MKTTCEVSLEELANWAPRHVEMRKHDVAPAVELQLTNQDETPFDLNGFTDATFYMVSAETYPYEQLLAADAVIDVANNTLRYVWQPGQTEIAGSFRAEFEVFDSDGRRRTFPADGHIWIQIRDDLDDA